MSNLKKVVSMPVKKIESLLKVLPKVCSCHICEATKSVAKENLGEKQYKSLCTSLEIFN